jgi:transposase
MITIMVLPTTRRDPELAEGELRALLQGLLQAGDQERLVETLVDLYTKVSRENDQLRLRILELTRRVHGRSSEKIDPNALRKALEELREQEFAQQDKGEQGAADDTPAAPRPKPPKAPPKPHPGRAPLSPHLPREERRHALAEGERLCECCQQPKQRIREEVAERLDYVPSRFIVIRDVTEVYGCSCGFSKPVAAEMPSRVIDGGLPEPGLLAHVVILKYEDHQPINRQSKIFAREGVTLSPNTLMEWIRAAAETLEPLAKRIHKRVLRSWIIQSDDTGLLVLDADKPQGARKGHLWANIGDSRFASYQYSPDWKHEHPASFLKGCAGYLQTDGYKGYDALTGGPPLAIRVGCFMHVRRYFLKAFSCVFRTDLGTESGLTWAPSPA